MIALLFLTLLAAVPSVAFAGDEASPVPGWVIPLFVAFVGVMLSIMGWVCIQLYLNVINASRTEVARLDKDREKTNAELKAAQDSIHALEIAQATNATTDQVTALERNFREVLTAEMEKLRVEISKMRHTSSQRAAPAKARRAS